MPRLPGTSIVKAFREDRWLAGAFLVLTLTALLPLTLTSLVPSPDLPGNVGGAALLFHRALGHAPSQEYYRVVWQPFPYWTGYLFLGGASLLLGPLAAAKLQVGVLIVALPLGVLRLALALGRNPRIALWAFLLVWEHNLYAGWHSFVLGMVIALIVIARSIEAREARDARLALPWSVLLVTTHVLPLLFAMVAVALVMLEPARRSVRRFAIVFAPTLLVLIPWLWVRYAAYSAAGFGVATTFDFPGPVDKLHTLFSASVATVPGTAGDLTSVLAFVVLLLGPLLLARAPEEPEDRHRWAALAVPAAGLALYCALPMSMSGPVDHWYTYPRFASYFLLALPLIPRPRLDGRRGLLVAPGVLVALAVHVTTAFAFRAFGQRTKPFEQILAAVPHGVRLLPLEYVVTDPSVRLEALAHAHSYLTAAHVLYDPHLFDNPNTPIRYRQDCFIPRIPWLGPRGFSLERYGRHYDYVLVQGLEHDPLLAAPDGGGVHARLVKEAGIWRLYALDRPR